MRPRPVWFGPVERPLFGWHQAPEGGAARATVVLCSPLGSEAANAICAYRELAERLSADGFAVMRFDYDGTGDSAGAWSDPDRLEAWIESTCSAVSFARSTGEQAIVLVGMRMGALLALRASGRSGMLAALALWDPCASGSQFMREQQALLAASYGAGQPQDGSLEAPAFVFAARTVEELRGLRNEQPQGAEIARTLIMTRAGRAPKGDLAAMGALAHADLLEVEGQQSLLEVPPDLLAVPTDDIAALARWLSETIGEARTSITVDSRQVATVGRSGDVEILERPVFLGPLPLFAILTEASTSSTGPLVVWLSAGALDHSGPARLWTELARSWSLSGVRSARVDLSGIGDSAQRPGQSRHIPKEPEAIEDLSDIAKALGSEDGSNLVFIGLSSGAYLAVEAGLHLKPRGICAINGSFTGYLPEASRIGVDQRRLAYRTMPRVLLALARKHGRTAEAIWKAITQIHVSAAPVSLLVEVARRGTAVLAVACEDESKELVGTAYWSVVRRGLARDGMLELRLFPGSDHSLYTRETREAVVRALSDWALTRYGAAPRADEGDAGGTTLRSDISAVNPGASAEHGSPV